jgi:hypothetical protein
MPSAKKVSGAMCTSSGITSVIVLISQPRPTFMPAQRSQTGQKSPPLSHLPAASTSQAFIQTRT